MNLFSPTFHYRAFFLVFATLSLLTYPTLYSTIHSYEITLPSQFIFTGLCLITLVCTKIKILTKTPYIIAIFSAYFLPLSISSLINPTVYLHNIITFAGYFIIPLTSALIWLESDQQKAAQFLIKILSLIWLINTIIYLITLDPYGLAGNQNWFAQLTLCTTPFTFLYLQKKNITKTIKISLLILISLLSLYLIYISYSRAVWLSILTFGYLFILLRLTFKKRLLLILATTTVIIFSFFNYQKHWQKIYQQDIRGPLYQSVSKMIFDNPKNALFGVGAGNFRKDFVDYRSDQHKSRGVSAKITEHPHNELLLLASSIGIIAAFIWLLFILRVIFIRPKDTFSQACYFSFITLLTQGFLDKVLSLSPTALIFPILFGILLAQPIKKYLSNSWKINNEKKQFFKIFISLILLVYIFYYSLHFFMSEFYFRKASKIKIVKNIKEINQKRQLYILSSIANPYNIKSYLSATNIDLFYLYPQLPKNQQNNIIQRSQRELTLARKIEPNYVNINQLWGELYYKKYLISNQKNDANLSIQYYQKNSQIYPYDGDSLFAEFNNLVQLKLIHQANQKFSHILTIYAQKLYQRFDDPQQKIHQLSKNLLNPKRYKKNLQELQELLRRVVGHTKDLYFSQQFATSSINSLLDTQLANQLDSYYWYQYLTIHKKISSKSIAQIITDTKQPTSNTQKNIYNLPLDYTQLANPSAITTASFLALCGTIKGYQTYIIKNQNTYQVIFLNKEKIFQINIKENLITSLTKIPNLAKSATVILNTFPQEFRVQASVMQKLLADSKIIPPTTLLPTLRLIKAKKLFPKNKIIFLEEAKNYFEKKLTKRKK